LNEEIITLIALQELDTEIAGFTRQVDEKNKEIMERKESIADKEEQIVLCRKKIQDLEERQRDLKAEHEDAQIRIKDRQNKMMLVQTSREHQALLKEIEDAKKAIKESEELQLKLMEQSEVLEKEIVELENLCAAEKNLLDEAAVKADDEIGKITSRRKTVENKRQKLGTALAAKIMQRYDMLLTKRSGNAVVRTIDGICQGCFMTIPPQQFNEVRKGSSLTFCPTCHRILYYLEKETEQLTD
jgi:predicted  nucleic acid-binding Zn-ribbon protein